MTFVAITAIDFLWSTPSGRVVDILMYTSVCLSCLVFRRRVGTNGEDSRADDGLASAASDR